MRVFQCSKCGNLEDYGEYCRCVIGIDPRPNHREKHDAKLCRENYKQLLPEKEWHERFSWE